MAGVWGVLTELPLNFIIILLIILVPIIYIMTYIAFKQGREVSFWPPKIGPKPEMKGVAPSLVERSGIVDILPSLEAISNILLQESALKIQRIRILARSWHSTLRKVQDQLLKLRDTDIYILLLNPNSRYVKERAKEDPYTSEEKVRSEIKGSIKLLKEIKEKYSLERLHVRVYDALPTLRMTFIDNFAFLSYYPKTAPGTTVPVFKMEKKKDSFYFGLERYFDSIWATSEEII